MEKQDHKKELNTKIHPTLSIYLSGNFNDPPVNSLNPSFNRDESVNTNCFVYLLNKLYKNKLQNSSVFGGMYAKMQDWDSHKRFSNSIPTLGYLQLLVSGLHFAWGMWRVDFNEEPWFQSVNGVFIFIVLSFYVGAIIGGIMSGCIINIWRKQATYVNRLLKFYC